MRLWAAGVICLAGVGVQGTSHEVLMEILQQNTVWHRQLLPPGQQSGACCTRLSGLAQGSRLAALWRGSGAQTGRWLLASTLKPAGSSSRAGQALLSGVCLPGFAA